MKNQVVIRDIKPEDADALVAMINALNEDQGYGPTLFTREAVLRDGFGDRSAFQAIVAEVGQGNLVGYAIISDVYNTDLAAKGSWLGDLYVDSNYRNEKVGKRLVAGAASLAKQRGSVSLWWTVLAQRDNARRFYQELGGCEDNDIVYFELDGVPFEKLASLNLNRT